METGDSVMVVFFRFTDIDRIWVLVNNNTVEEQLVQYQRQKKINVISLSCVGGW